MNARSLALRPVFVVRIFRRVRRGFGVAVLIACLVGALLMTDMTRASQRAVASLCEAATIELARLLQYVSVQGLREEMLFPGLASAARTPTVEVFVEVRNDGRRYGESRKRGRGAPRRADLLLVESRDSGGALAYLIEVKICKTVGGRIRLDRKRLPDSKSFKHHRLSGIAQCRTIVIAVVRVPVRTIRRIELDARSFREHARDTIASRLRGTVCVGRVISCSILASERFPTVALAFCPDQDCGPS
jgi:hypothetical protein